MNKKGFTLVELAIVLVIIGLLVGGVLQGQELIKQAQIRNVLTSIREYDTAINTFRSKYNNALPGDFNQAVAFGICVLPGTTTQNCADSSAVGGTATTTGNGDGDGVLESTNNNATTFGGEVANFFVELGNAHLVKGNYSQQTPNSDAGVGYPALPVGGGFIAVSQGGLVYYLLGLNSGGGGAGLQGAASKTATTSILGTSFTPQDAYAIDSKVDDGQALTGSTFAVQQYRGFTTNFTKPTAGTGTTSCVDSASTNGTGYRYATTAQACSLGMRASS